jgi:hypothetical protein
VLQRLDSRLQIHCFLQCSVLVWGPQSLEEEEEDESGIESDSVGDHNSNNNNSKPANKVLID